MKKLFILVVLFKYTISYCQELPKVVPLSPEASSIFKFMEIPVSLYGGTQNTTIPLIDINVDGLSLPITLSYNSRGVQVSEVSSRVGNGWTLNYGGMVSRQIRGLADEALGGYNGTSNSTDLFYSNNNLRNSELESSMYNLPYDSYPDKFMLSSNFYSGEFYFDKNNSQITTQRFSDTKIYGSTNGPFVAKDNLGNVFSFGGQSTDADSQYLNEYDFIVSSLNSPMGGFIYPDPNPNSAEITYSSWNLRKVVTPSNQIVEYFYTNEIVTVVRRNGDIEHVNSGNYQPGTPEVTCKYVIAYSHQKVLDEIVYKHGKIKFIKGAVERLDLEGGRVLDRIEQYNVKNELVKVIQFNYEYNIGFEDANINNHLQLADDRATKRLFLKSVVIKDKNISSTKEERYSFEYDEQSLPSRHSNSVDFYGYYNGKNRGRFLRFGDVGGNGNSSVHSTRVQAGILKKVTYPTGGSTVFEYEPNVLNNELPDAIKIPNINNVENVPQIISTISPQLYNIGNNRYELPFTVNNLISPSATANLHVPPGVFKCILKNETTGTSTLLGVVSGQFSSSGVYQITIGAGSYTLIVDPRYSDWNPTPDPLTNDPEEPNPINYPFVVSVNYINSDFDSEQITYGPGNRIKKIINYSAKDIEEFSRFYEYVRDNNTPSGHLLTVSNFKVRHPAYSMSSYVYDHTPNLPGGLFNSYVKDNFGYTQVNEYLSDKDDNIREKTSHYYSIIPDLGSYYKFPLHPVTDNEWLRGKELQTIVFKKENNVFLPVKKVENEYLLYGTKPIFYPTYPFALEQGYMPAGMVVEFEKPFCLGSTFEYLRNSTSFVYPTSTGCPYYSISHSTCGPLNTNLINGLYHTKGYRTTSFIGGTFDLKTTKVTDYFDNNTEIETLTTYDYDYSNHYNVAKTTSTSSTGETIETNYSYAKNTNHQVLIDKNMVGIPLITEVKRNGDLLSTQESVYKDWGPLLLPEVIKTSKGNNPLEVKIRYNKVDSDGNPLEVQQENGMKISYIWGYEYTQPVAKLENIAYADIPTNLRTTIEGISNHPLTTETEMLEALDALRTSNNASLQKAMITTYTYIPLVGVSTITDPKGDKITYHYDGFNRLEFIKDKDGHILKENKYHYRTQN